MKARDLLRDVERAEAQTLAAGQLARRLLADHPIPTHRMRIKHRYAPDAPGRYVMALEIWARDADALLDWAAALDARIDSSPAKDGGGAELSVHTAVGAVPVHVWVFTGTPAEITRHQGAPITRAVTA